MIKYRPKKLWIRWLKRFHQCDTYFSTHVLTRYSLFPGCLPVFDFLPCAFNFHYFLLSIPVTNRDSVISCAPIPQDNYSPQTVRIMRKCSNLFAALPLDSLYENNDFAVIQMSFIFRASPTLLTKLEIQNNIKNNTKNIHIGHVYIQDDLYI